MSDVNENPDDTDPEILADDEIDEDDYQVVSPISFVISTSQFSESPNDLDDFNFGENESFLTGSRPTIGSFSESSLSSLPENSNDTHNTTGFLTDTNDSFTSVASIFSEPSIEYDSLSPSTRSVLRIFNQTSNNGQIVEAQPEPQIDRNQSINEDGEPPTKCARIESDVDVPDGQTCPICFESWTSSGEHRLVSLKCGHLFGSSCIVRWLKPRENRVCPTCKSKAIVKDIRFIYARSVSFVDNSEIEAVKLELERTKTAKNGVEFELKCLKSTQELQKNKINALKAVIEKLKSNPSELITFEKWHFSTEKNLPVSQQGECRVFTYNKRQNSLFISQMNSNNLFSGCNVEELDCETYNISNLTRLHQKEIRGITYSDHLNLVMSVSLDKKIKILSANSGSEAMSIPTDVALWCCSWDVSEPNRICVGGTSGNIMLYDIRQTKACLFRVHDTKDWTPVISLASVSDNVVSCSLNSLQIHTKNESGGFDSKNQGIAGPFYDMNYNFGTKSLILSTRPSGPVQHCKHNVFEFDLLKQTSVGNTLKHFFSSKTMAQIIKSFQFQISDSRLFSQYNESKNSINVWNIDRECVVDTLSSRDLVLDLCSWTRGPNMFLASLTKKEVKIYKLYNDS